MPGKLGRNIRMMGCKLLLLPQPVAVTVVYLLPTCPLAPGAVAQAKDQILPNSSPPEAATKIICRHFVNLWVVYVNYLHGQH